MPFLSPCFNYSHEDKSTRINQFTKSWVGNIMALKVGNNVALKVGNNVALKMGNNVALNLF